jgi:hypothetical protein
MMRTNVENTGSLIRSQPSLWASSFITASAFWPVSVTAAGFFLENDQISWQKLGYVIFMSLWGALAALLHRFSKGQDIGQRRLVAARDVVNATLASFLTFLICEHFAVPPALAAVAFTLGGYGGARFMEFLYSKWVGKIGKTIDDA